MVVSYDSLARHSWHASKGEGFSSDESNAIHILLVEDSASDRLLMLRALDLTKLPYTLDHTDNGDDVLPYLAQASHEKKMPDLILLDMGLPGTDGFEILEKLAAAPARMRSASIVIITVYPNFDYLKRTNDLPVYGYLTKPINVENLKEILSKVSSFVSTKKKNYPLVLTQAQLASFEIETPLLPRTAS